MALKHLVLGILRREPAHGYRVAARLLELAGAVRRVEPARVYETLAGLEREGAIEARSESRGGRERRVWETTEVGRRELERWFSRPVPSAVWLRRPLLARLAIAGVPSPGRTEAARAELSARRRALARIDAPSRTGSGHASKESRLPMRAALDRADRERERTQLEVEIELLEAWVALGPAPVPSAHATRVGPGTAVSPPPRRPCLPLPGPKSGPAPRSAPASR